VSLARVTVSSVSRGADVELVYICLIAFLVGLLYALLRG
jgi:hypothetical protein